MLRPWLWVGRQGEAVHLSPSSHTRPWRREPGHQLLGEHELALLTHALLPPLLQRKLGQLDKEALELTSQILGANPDFATLWNFRREIFLHLAEE